MLPPFRHGSLLESPLTLSKLPSVSNWDGKIAYLDRDGVLNKWSDNYVNTPAEVHLLPGSGKAVGDLRRGGYRTCVVTNQSPVGRGMWSHSRLEKIHDRLQKLLLLEDKDATLDLILYSPYAPWENSWSRKPNPGMLEASRQLIENASDDSKNGNPLLFGNDWGDRPSEGQSVLVGDQDSDIHAANSFGVRALKCSTNGGINEVIGKIISN